MNLFQRAAGFVIGAAAIAGGQLWLEHAAFPRQAAAVSVESVNGSDETALRARLLGPLQTAADDAAIVLIVTLAAACFAKPVMEQMTSTWGSRLKGESRA
jgi:hypothetical protein